MKFKNFILPRILLIQMLGLQSMNLSRYNEYCVLNIFIYLEYLLLLISNRWIIFLNRFYPWSKVMCCQYLSVSLFPNSSEHLSQLTWNFKGRFPVIGEGFRLNIFWILPPNHRNTGKICFNTSIDDIFFLIQNERFTCANN